MKYFFNPWYVDMPALGCIQEPQMMTPSLETALQKLTRPPRLPQQSNEAINASKYSETCTSRFTNTTNPLPEIRGSLDEQHAGSTIQHQLSASVTSQYSNMSTCIYVRNSSLMQLQLFRSPVGALSAKTSHPRETNVIDSPRKNKMK